MGSFYLFIYSLVLWASAKLVMLPQFKNKNWWRLIFVFNIQGRLTWSFIIALGLIEEGYHNCIETIIFRGAELTGGLRWFVILMSFEFFETPFLTLDSLVLSFLSSCVEPTWIVCFLAIKQKMRVSRSTNYCLLYYLRTI